MSNLGSLLSRWFRQTRRMFHMLVGLAFLVLTLAGAWVSIERWSDYRSAPKQGWVSFELVAFPGFTVLLFILCLYSFAKARSVR